VDWGFTEVYTNSLVSKQLAQWSGFALKTHLSVSNPLSEDQVYLRRSLIPSHLEVMKSNEVRGRRSIFEIAHVYYPRLGKKLPHEKLKLVMTTDGPLSAIKATVTMLLEKLRINYQFPPRNGAWVLTNPARSTAISAADRIVGRLGELNASHLEAFQLNSVISVAEFNLKALQGLVRTHPAYQVLPQYPPLIEDLTFIFPEKTYLGQVIEEMTSLSRLVESVVLKETYQRNSTFTITYRHPDRSLTDKDISPVRIKIKTFLEKYFRAKLIGTL
jgi:phenylalanyl-tRNA synthetase beta chain